MQNTTKYLNTVAYTCEKVISVEHVFSNKNENRKCLFIYCIFSKILDKILIQIHYFFMKSDIFYIHLTNFGRHKDLSTLQCDIHLQFAVLVNITFSG